MALRDPARSYQVDVAAFAYATCRCTRFQNLRWARCQNILMPWVLMGSGSTPLSGSTVGCLSCSVGSAYAMKVLVVLFVRNKFHHKIDLLDFPLLISEHGLWA